MNKFFLLFNEIKVKLWSQTPNHKTPQIQPYPTKSQLVPRGLSLTSMNTTNKTQIMKVSQSGLLYLTWEKNQADSKMKDMG